MIYVPQMVKKALLRRPGFNKCPCEDFLSWTVCSIPVNDAVKEIGDGPIKVNKASNFILVFVLDEYSRGCTR